MSEQPRYRVAERSFIDNVLVEPGGEVTYTGEPGEHLQPLNASAEKAVAAAKKKRAAEQGRSAGDEGKFTVVRTGKDLESPFDPANPPEGDGEGKRGSRRRTAERPAHPNPQANRPGDPQAEVGPTEDEVDGPKATEKAQKEAEQAKDSDKGDEFS